MIIDSKTLDNIINIVIYDIKRRLIKLKVDIDIDNQLNNGGII